MEEREERFQLVEEFSFDVQKSVVRTLLDREGEPWFVAKDVCDILEHTNHKMAIQSLDEDEKGVSKVYSLGGVQETNIINESGLYSLIFRSNKPQAKVFRKWVTGEVLPTIRKQGLFGIPLTMDVPEDPQGALSLWVYLGKHRNALQSRLVAVRALEKKASIQVKLSARPYHVPMDKQISLLQGV